MSDVESDMKKPLGKKTKLPSSTTQHTDQSSQKALENVMVFHKPSKRLFTFNLNKPTEDQQITLFFPKRQKLVNLNLKTDKMREDMKAAIAASLEETKEESGKKSIEDVMWKEVKLEYSKLYPSYLRLSKIRLTGNSFVI